MRVATALTLLLLIGTPAVAAPARTAVFDIELLDLSLEGAGGPRADETRRLALVSDELRRLLNGSSEVEEIDIASQAETVRRRGPLFRCNGCAEEIGKALDADLVVSGYVQKTSNLILSFVLTVTDVRTGKVIRGAQTDIRGNTEEMWLRGMRFMVKNRLLAEPLQRPT